MSASLHSFSKQYKKRYLQLNIIQDRVCVCVCVVQILLVVISMVVCVGSTADMFSGIYLCFAMYWIYNHRSLYIVRNRGFKWLVTINWAFVALLMLYQVLCRMPCHMLMPGAINFFVAVVVVVVVFLSLGACLEHICVGA